MRTRFLTLLALLALMLGGAVLTACGDDDGDDGGTVSELSPQPEADPDPEADPEAEPDPEADPEAEPDPEADPEAEPDPEADPEAAVATPAPKPEGATQVDVTLEEWAIELSTDTVAAGEIYFLVTNEGPDDAHEFVVIKSDLAPDALPVEEGKVPEDEVNLIDEIEPFEVGTTGSLTLDLEPGSYVLICNIAEVEDGEIESHYELGMRTAFTVE